VKIFINYRSDDVGHAAVLLDHVLSERFGASQVFRDSRSIELGRDYRPELWGSLARSLVLLAVIGPRWMAVDADGKRRIDDPRDFVRREIGLALQTAMRVVPILVDQAPVLEPIDLPEEIRDLALRQYLRLNTRTANHDVRRLVDELAQILDTEAATGLPETPETTPSTTGNAQPASRHTIDVRHSQGVQIGDHGTQTNTFTPPA
jgi:hypothetical protein